MSNGTKSGAGANPFKDALSSFPDIIKSVTSILGLSALAILTMALVLWLTPREASISIHLLAASSILLVYLIALIFTYLFDRTEITFRVRISRLSEGIEVPGPGMCVRLLRDGKMVQEKVADESGDLFFTVKVRRKDNLSVHVLDPETKEPKVSPAPIYSEGQCMIPKKILVP